MAWKPEFSDFHPKNSEMLVRLLPVHDLSIDADDAAFASSVASYRVPGKTDEESGSESFSAFFVRVLAHPFWGNSNVGMVSPETLARLSPDRLPPAETADPIVDCYWAARNSEREEWKALTAKQPGQFQPVLRKPQIHVFFNALVQRNGEEWKQGILVLKQAGLDHLIEQLNWRQPAGEDPIHTQEAWGRYLLGDVTDPEEGLVARVTLTDVGSISSYALHYTERPYEARGVRRMPVDEDVLRRRRDLGSDRTLKILTYQEMVDIMVADGCLPLELIREACGNLAQVTRRGRIGSAEHRCGGLRGVGYCRGARFGSGLHCCPQRDATIRGGGGIGGQVGPGLAILGHLGPLTALLKQFGAFTSAPEGWGGQERTRRWMILFSCAAQLLKRAFEAGS